MTQRSRATTLSAVILAIFATAAVFAFAFGYTRFGRDFVFGLEAALGEVLMREGIRLEEAGAWANAEAAYRQALDSNFDGEFNRTYTMKRLGTLVMTHHGPEAALPVLEATAARPDAPLSVYEPLTGALFDLKRFAEAEGIVTTWLDQARAAEVPAAVALAENYAGRLAAQRGDLEAARQHYEAGYTLEPHGRNAYALAEWHYQAQNYVEAIEYAEDFLQTGTGARADYMRDVRRISAERLDN